MNYLKIANALIKAYELDVEPDDLAAYVKKIDVGAAKAKRPAAEVEAEAEEGAIEYSEPDENHVVMFKTPQTCVRIVTPKGGASAPCGAKAIRGLVGDDGEVQGCCGTVASGHLAAMIRDSKKESAKAGPTAKAAKAAKATPGGGVKKLVAKNLGVYVEERERVTEVPGTKYFKDSTGLLFVKTHDSYEVVGVLTKQGGKVVPGKITVEARKSIQRRNLPVAASATYVTLDGEDAEEDAEEEEVVEDEEPKPKAKAPKAKAPKVKAPPPEDEEEEEVEEEEPKPKAKAKAKAVPKTKTPKAKAPPPEEDEVDDAEEVVEDEEPKPKAKAPKAKAPKVKAPPPEDEEEVVEDEEPKPKAKAPKAKAPKVKAPPPKDEEEEEEVEEEPKAKASKAPKAKAPKAKAPPPEDEDAEEEVPPPKAKAKAVPKKAFIDVVEEDEGEAYDGEEDDEEDEE